MTKKSLSIIISVTVILLLIPLIAMQLSNDVQWKTSDFLMAAILLLSAGIATDLIIRKVQKKESKIVFILAILVIIAIIFIELAVGLFDSPFAGS
jgi:Kef-type K+ transport system membrane component KefB